MTDPAPMSAHHPDEIPDRHDVPQGGRSGFVVVDDRQVHYLEWGRRGLPTIVGLHGGGQTAYMYEELGAALASTHHFLAPDMPNHGDSDPLADPDAFGPLAYAETMPPLLAEMGFERSVFIGASLGGLTTMALTPRHPELVAGIVLIDIGHRLEGAGVQKIIDFMRSRDSFESLEEAAEYIGQYLPYRKSFRPESLTRNLRKRADGRWIWKHGMGRRWERRGQTEDELGPDGAPDLSWTGVMEGIAEDAAAIDVPVLLLRGRQSDVLSGDAADELMGILKQGRLETVEKAGHLAAGDNPHSTVSLVRDFLADVGW